MDIVTVHIATKRKCLVCGEQFDSKWIGNRVCGTCQHSQVRLDMYNSEEYHLTSIVLHPLYTLPIASFALIKKTFPALRIKRKKKV